MRGVAIFRASQSTAHASQRCGQALRHSTRKLEACSAAPRPAAAAPTRRSERRPARLAARVQARRADPEDVVFDDEEDWEQQGSAVQAPGLGPILGTAMRGLSLVTDKLTDVALPYAPADASPGVVRVTVSAGLVLLALSFVKSLLSFFLTLGTIFLGAYVAVRVFGVDVPGVTSSSEGGGRGGASRPRTSQQQQQRRKLDPRARQSEFKGLLSSLSGEDDGLLDVRFERKKGGDSKRRR